MFIEARGPTFLWFFFTTILKMTGLEVCYFTVLDFSVIAIAPRILCKHKPASWRGNQNSMKDVIILNHQII
jgi:hypothetical protein